MRRPVLLLSALAASASVGIVVQGADAAPPAPSYYKAEVAPILQANCAVCHLTGQEAGNMTLVPSKAIANLVNTAAREAPALKRVVPGDPGKSYLLMKLLGTHVQNGGTGARMPFGAAPLPPEKIAVISKWIADGAKP